MTIEPEAPIPLNLLITIDETTFDAVLNITPELFSKREAPPDLALATAWNSADWAARHALITELAMQTIRAFREPGWFEKRKREIARRNREAFRRLAAQGPAGEHEPRP